MMFSYLLLKYVKGNLIFHEVQLTYLRILCHCSLSTIPAPPLKILKSRRFSDDFMGYRKRSLA